MEGKYSYVIATHIDHDHIHNHIVFCAADNINHIRYHDCEETYKEIRRYNDTHKYGLNAKDFKVVGESKLQVDNNNGTNYVINNSIFISLFFLFVCLKCFV